MPIRRPERRRPCRRGPADARRGQAAQLRGPAGRAGDRADGERARVEWLRVGVGERPRRDAGDREVAVPVRRRRCRHVGDGRPVVRLDRRPGDGRRRHRHGRARHRRARAAATQPGRARQAGRQPRSARRRAGRARGRRRVAGRGVRRPGHAVRVARRPHRRVDRPVAGVLDRPARTPSTASTTSCRPTSCASRHRRAPVPILVGGTTPPALRRARQRGDGWLGIQPADAIDVGAIEAAVAQLDQRRPQGAADRRLGGRSASRSPRRCRPRRRRASPTWSSTSTGTADVAAQAASLLDAAG